jgi:hypothetical protein
MRACGGGGGIMGSFKMGRNGAGSMPVVGIADEDDTVVGMGCSGSIADDDNDDNDNEEEEEEIDVVDDELDCRGNDDDADNDKG